MTAEAVDAKQVGARASLAVKRLAVKAVLERGLIADGDRILLAVSGGKDSTVLAWALSAIRRAVRKDYALEALHISSDFCVCCKKAALADRLAEWGVPFHDLFVPVVGRLKAGKKMNCYWCSTQRRTELLKYAAGHGFNKIALGHHLDDIIETFFMNLLHKGELAAMPLLLAYRKYPASLIRPLAYAEERQVVECAAEQGILKTACTCPYGQNSLRRDVRRRIAGLWSDSGAAKRRLFKALLDAGLLTR
ncbi:tRNA 2-thiocytidine biosynthesis TtcA family protein [Treponema endosymbiont of Eucomonympha sp.]|uniref:tRNA 2-thiocytidine biosynthesis TtcA family protein n=1 Tax=Treponema endosymbiont of Eucomonympha sp. TaxID=1580831 RepID=UPI000A416614|nr:tRNA 2-thiocytidine biosynthesis TtcA family protein [Treponema endosymbiont of Eucomonympha sp.]